MIIIEIILMGCFATLLMDLAGRRLASGKLIYAFLSAEEVGRWFLYAFRGKIRHIDIRQTPQFKHEKEAYYIMHYLIGIFLAGVFTLLSDNESRVLIAMISALAYGIITVVFPWLMLLPGCGFGILANKSKDRYRIIRTNLIHHTNFGVGLMLWIGISNLIKLI